MAGVAALLLTTSACLSVNVKSDGDLGLAPSCAPAPRSFDRTIILIAQSVPTASSLPCIRGPLPQGWALSDLEIKRGSARFWLALDREGDKALLVQLAGSCDVSGATQVASEQTGMRQYERVSRLQGGYGGTRYYVYPGGCTTYEFDLRGESRAQPLAAIAQTLSFISRDTLRQQVRDRSDGRLELDPGART
jgi:hypothetical protein